MINNSIYIGQTRLVFWVAMRIFGYSTAMMTRSTTIHTMDTTPPTRTTDGAFYPGSKNPVFCGRYIIFERFSRLEAELLIFHERRSVFLVDEHVRTYLQLQNRPISSLTSMSLHPLLQINGES